MHHSYVGRMLRLLCSIALLGVASAMTASAGKLVLKIQAVNKTDSEQQIEIRSSLPSRITTLSGSRKFCCDLSLDLPCT